MELKQYMTHNRCYTSPVQITPKYVIVHSTGAAIGTADNLYKKWNTATSSKSVHAMVDNINIVYTMPLNVMCWHIRGDANNSQAVGFEICEPANMVYADAAHTTIDTDAYNPRDTAVIADFVARWNNAVIAAAHMCRECNIPVNCVISHAEAHAMGIASNHADTAHWFKLFSGYDMDAFRRAVTRALKQSTGIRYRVQVGSFKNLEYAEQLRDGLRRAGYGNAYIVECEL